MVRKRRLQHHYSLDQDAGERVPEIMGHDGKHLVPRLHRPLFTQEPPLEIDFDGVALQLVCGFDVARGPWTRAQSHLLTPQRERMTRTEAIPGERRDRLGWIAAPAHG